MKIDDEDCKRCNQYLREHRMVTIEELSKGTNIELTQITRYIREKRISIASSPNLRYGCESCNTPIREGNLCQACRSRFNRVLTDEQKKEVQTQQEVIRNTFLNKNKPK